MFSEKGLDISKYMFKIKDNTMDIRKKELENIKNNRFFEKITLKLKLRNCLIYTSK